MPLQNREQTNQSPSDLGPPPIAGYVEANSDEVILDTQYAPYQQPPAVGAARKQKAAKTSLRNTLNQSQ